MTEIQIESIYKKAQALSSIALEPLARKVLEIDLNAESSKNQDLLTRLIKSLEQYINKEQTLIYIGFVGHYSSGKSSTINKILSLNETVYERSTGLNPTDKAITLITDIQNSNSLILMNRESGNVPVRSSLLKNDILKPIVIADTPGSGDPQVVNEMIQDFLPICDYIFYFISAANPIDQADLPLLQKKSLMLPFIPIIYIITRTDEFRLDKKLPLTEENINKSKKDLFTGQLISRIKEIINVNEINTDSFIFIDNEYEYNIIELKKKITDWTNYLDKQELLKIHGYKVEYYRTNLTSIFNYFTFIIDQKIKKSKEFLKTANENIIRFDKSIEINNEKLRLLWAKSEMNLKQALSDEKKTLDEINQNFFSTSLVYDKDLQAQKKLINQGLENQANGYTGRTILDLNNHFKQKLRESKHEILENISSGDIMMENISHLFPGRLKFDITNSLLEIDFYKLNEYVKIYSEKITEILNEVKNSLKTRCQQLKSHISKKILVSEILKLYQGGHLNINENFDQYFERIQMYRSTVLTRNTKETIEKLRIGTQLDELDDEFSEDYILEKKGNAIKDVYIDNNEDVNKFYHYLEGASSELLNLRNDIDNIEINNRDNIHNEFFKESVDISSFTGAIIAHGERAINLMYQDQLTKVLDAHKRNYDEYLQGLMILKEKRRRSIIKWTLTIGFVFVVIYASLRLFSIVSPSTIFSDIVIGLISTVIGNIAGLILGMFKTDLKKAFIQSKEQFISNSRSEILQLFGESFWDDLSKKNLEVRNEVDLISFKTMFNDKLNPILSSIVDNRQLTLNELISISNGMSNIVNKHKLMLDQIYTKCSLLFTDPEKNLSKIGIITKEIKEIAIKPSFELLKETTQDLENVKAQILSI